MLLWRISNHADLLGIGGTLAPARWHSAGKPIVYLAESPASALLEVLVHLELNEELRPSTYQILKVEADPEVRHEEVTLASLSSDWTRDETETRRRGDDWLASGASALLRVPSVIAPETWNWILNPRHPEAAQVRILAVERHLYDSRLFER